MLTPREAFVGQAEYCEANDAPLTAAICRSLADGLDEASAVGARVLAWPGDPVADALPLRLVGGLHALFRAGDAPELTPVFVDGKRLSADALRAVLTAHQVALLSWLDGPPQTNEPGRSAQLMTGLLEVAKRHGPRLELLEIGSSAGLNLLIGHYRIDLGSVSIGPPDSPVRLQPEWRGTPVPQVPVEIVSARGVDIAPLDATRAEGAARLLGYVWADHRIRFERLEHALQLLRRHPPRLDAGDAPDWLAARLAEPQAAGVTRVLMHSIVWQYLGSARQARIEQLMADAAARATTERPLAWVRVEADRTVHQHDITVQSWPGHGERLLLGHAHPHGFWVERRAGPE